MTTSTGTIVLSCFMALGGVLALAAVATHVYEYRLTSRKEKAKKAADDEEKARQSISSSKLGVNPLSPGIISSPPFPQTPILHIRSPVSPNPVYSPTTPLTPYTSTGLFRPISDSDSRPLLAGSPTSPHPVYTRSSRTTGSEDVFTSPAPSLNLSKLRQFTTPPRGPKRAPGLASKKERQAVSTEGDELPKFILARSVSELVGKPVASSDRLASSEVRESISKDYVDKTESNMQEMSRFGW